MQDDSQVDEGIRPTFVGHLLIRDPESGEILLNQRDIPVQHHDILKGNTDASD